MLLWRVSDGSLLRALEGHQGPIWSVTFTPDGSLLAVGGEDATVLLWRTSDGSIQSLSRIKLLWSWWAKLRVLSKMELSWSWLAWAKLKVWWAKLNVWSVAFSPDGGLLTLGRDVTTVWLWRVSDGRLLSALGGYKGQITSVAFSPDGGLLASGGSDKTVRLWQLSGGRLLRALEGHEGEILSVAFSPDGGLLASGGSDKTVRLWTSK